MSGRYVLCKKISGGVSLEIHRRKNKLIRKNELTKLEFTIL